MKTSRHFARLRPSAPPRRATSAARLALGALACLLPLAAPATNYTWTGGGGPISSQVSNPVNWDGSAPLSDINSTFLIFPSDPAPPSFPIFDTPLAFAGVQFASGAPSYTFVVSPLTVGISGFTNLGAQTQTITNVVTVGTPTSIVTTFAGPLTFSGQINLGTNALTVAGSGDTSFANFGGTGSVTKTGAGTMTWAPTANTSADLIINAGTVNTVADGSTDILNGSASIAVNGTSTLFIAENLTLDGGAQLTRQVGATVLLQSDKTLTIQGGSDAIYTGSASLPGNTTVTGAGSTVRTLSGGIFEVFGGQALTIQSGGSANLSGGLQLGPLGGLLIRVSVDGIGSSLIVGGPTVLLRQSAVSISNGATASLAGLTISSAQVGNVFVLTGGNVTNSGSINIQGSNPGFPASSLTVNGSGSTWTQTGSSSITIGASSGENIALNVQNGGLFITSTAGATLNATGAINIDGGTLILSGPLVRNGGALNFNSGGLSTVESWNVGSGGLLGANVTIDATRRFTTQGTTTVNQFNTLTLNGGSLNTATLVNNGTVAFQSGSLGITGAAGFNIGTGALGSNVTLGTGSTLKVTNTATIASGATLTVNGGTFTPGALSNSGTLRVTAGQANIGPMTNASGGRIFVGGTLTASGAWANAAGSRLTLENGGLVNGAGAIANSGIVTGNGMIANGFNNASGGEVRGEAGSTLTFTGTTGANAGRLNLLGGTLQFSQQFTNAAAGQINGAGTLFFPTTPVPSSASPTAGLMNAGRLSFSGGDTQVFGTVQMQAGSQLIVSGGATATFYDVFRHSGLTVKADAGANLVFFGEVRGAGSFSGSGTTSFNGGYTPGNSPALVTFDGDVVFGSTSALTLEIGGLVAGTEYDRLEIAQQLVEGGALEITLYGGYVPHLGDHFDFFDAGTITGRFDTVNLPSLGGGLAWDSSSLQSNGQLAVVPEPTTGMLLVSGLVLASLRRRRGQGSKESTAMRPACHA